ncbi:hypothetical protein BN2475_300010 [Paraburkholderia ribeironis]|uniref:Uncharacterized protein n=1 Tax=Paraburkholderia ribeironis TaxID=1247936 RepID=A0A1N7S1T6_9BURK|nr:hypothetical protein BN2475_300010 [Paraburkholderia ribeironis]
MALLFLEQPLKGARNGRTTVLFKSGALVRYCRHGLLFHSKKRVAAVIRRPFSALYQTAQIDPPFG